MDSLLVNPAATSFFFACPFEGQALNPIAEHRFRGQCADFVVCVSAGEKCY
jgi:hypothetical protein